MRRLLPALLAAVRCGGAGGTAACPPHAPMLQGSGVAWGGGTFAVCEQPRPGGDVVFVPEQQHGDRDGRRPQAAVTIPRSAERQYAEDENATCWLNFSRAEVLRSAADLLGNELLRRGNPTLRDVRAVLPPMVMSADDSVPGDPPTGLTHTFVGSRSSSNDVCFDVAGADNTKMAYPGMGQHKNKYGKTYATWKDELVQKEQLEGLWG